ncbi:MAG: UvrD-helicase domain-containing protein [Nitrospinae bacterium]|nr:UvrD-helicase domain-containing protein [Nitrospinota bacterium]
METILKFGGDTAVHASAGTGKTWLLVEKFLHELSTETEGRFPGIENIAAITFTEKAADEMRRRIATRIFEITAKAADAPMDAAAARLHRHFAASRRRMARAYVSTIHSFCARVLRENPVEAGIDPLFEIMDERRARTLMEGALRQFLTLKLRRRDAAMMDLAYRYGFAGTGNNDGSLAAILADMLPLARASGMAHGALLAPYAGFMPAHRAVINGRFAALRRDFSIAASHSGNPEAKEMLARAERLLPVLEAALDADPEEAVRLAVAVRKGINAGKIRKASAELKQIKETLEGIEHDVAGALSHRQAEALTTLLEEFRRHYQTGVKNRGRLDFDDLEEMTIALFKHNPDIRSAYQRNFRKVLVDEFQDVNHIQKELIYLLAAPGEGKLFVVGDPKQAIYGFRGGDVDVFKEAKKEITERGGELFFLKTNRRSVKELVDFTNGVILKSVPALFTADDECETAPPAAGGRTAGGPAVEFFLNENSASADENRYLEARRIASRIRDMAAEGAACYRDIAILFRKFTALPLYESVFRAYGIPLAVHKGAGFYQSQEVRDLVSLLAFIEDPGDLVSWAAALRSPYAGCSDETLLALRRGADMKPAPPDRADAGAIADAGEREKYRHFEDWTGRLRRAKGRMTVSEIIETALRESGITGILGAQPNGLQQVANVQKVIELARAEDRGGTAALKSFTREILGMIDGDETEPQAVIANPDMDVVKVMTIHQSKGLEFKVVFVPDVTAAARGRPSPVAFHLRAGLGLKYMDKARLATHQGAVYKQVKALIDAKERDDAERLFYVACTRAKDKLVLSGSLKKKGAERLVMLLEAQARLPHLFTRITGSAPPPAAAPRQSAWDVLRTLPAPPAAPEIAEAPRPNGGGVVRLSVGQITAFRKCPRKYLLRHIHGLQPPPGPAGARRTPAAEAGTAVHALLETLDFTAPEKEFRRAAEQGAAAHLAGLDKTTRKEAKSAVVNLYGRDIFVKLRREGLHSFGREIPFTLGYARGKERCLLAGTMDALAFTRAGNVYVIDYKYAEKPARAKLDEAMMQPRLYALAAARALPVTGGITCALVYLRGKDAATEEDSVTPDELGRIETALTADSEKIVAFEGSGGRMPEWPAVPPASCPDRFCGFHRFCFPFQGDTRGG